MILLLVLVGLIAYWRGGHRRYLRGRHLSAPLVRLVGLRRTNHLRMALSLVGIPLALTEQGLWDGWLVAVVAWAVDDWLTGDDDDRRRRPLEQAARRLADALRPLPYRTSTGSA